MGETRQTAAGPSAYARTANTWETEHGDAGFTVKYPEDGGIDTDPKLGGDAHARRVREQERRQSGRERETCSDGPQKT
ncbi:hypothetical protein M408DRAFT_330741 [Serendipita vermifera MAFF 305830]|uniref:Uncharacterized protein n=1 Tax=Serendipita vermifera MAFF 305830 TaxID=933852 RepID=A0A0C2XAF9_SERVB|nr:hypothetical protein M408DRAFT_330741 [Serendipita vermifera MAFF 305830]